VRGCRSVAACRRGKPLTEWRNGGRLHPLLGAPGFGDPTGRLGPFVRVVCPTCGQRRDYRLVAPARGRVGAERAPVPPLRIANSSSTGGTPA
jgi:hypothetical protein